MDPIPISQKSFFSGTEEISSITVALNEMAKELDKKIATLITNYIINYYSRIAQKKTPIKLITGV